MLRNVEWKEALILSMITDTSGSWFRFEDNTIPNTVTWHGGLRGVSYNLRPKTVASKGASGESAFPFTATITGTVEIIPISSGIYYNYSTLELGAEVTVIKESSRFFTVEYRNGIYKLENKSKVDIKNSRPASVEIPAELNREFPFDATITENIDIQILYSTNIVKVPAGTIVTVTDKGGRGYNELRDMTVLVDGKNTTVNVKYLRPVD